MFCAHETWFDIFAGRVAEFDTPLRLLEDKSSMFFKLVTEYSSRSSGIPDFWNGSHAWEPASQGGKSRRRPKTEPAEDAPLIAAASRKLIHKREGERCVLCYQSRTPEEEISY